MIAIKFQSVPALAERCQSHCGVIQIFPWGPQGIFGPSSDELNEKAATVASWDWLELVEATKEKQKKKIYLRIKCSLH